MYWYKLLRQNNYEFIVGCCYDLNVYCFLFIHPSLPNDGLNCRVGDIWDRQMHNDNNCEIFGCRKLLRLLQSQHEKDHKVQRHFESFSRLQVIELWVNPLQAFFLLYTVNKKIILKCVVQTGLSWLISNKRYVFLKTQETKITHILALSFEIYLSLFLWETSWWCAAEFN